MLKRVLQATPFQLYDADVIDALQVFTDIVRAVRVLFWHLFAVFRKPFKQSSELFGLF